MDPVATLLSNIPLLIFFVVGTVTVASSALVVLMRNPVHSALFLLLTFLCVAILFVLAGAEFVGAVQVLVYAGGIMVLFLFVVMLINVRALSDERMFSPYWKGGLGIAVVLFIIVAAVVRPGAYAEERRDPRELGMRTVRTSRLVEKEDGRIVRQRGREQRSFNSEAIAMSLYRDYLVPFEVASVFLLVAMIGAIVIGKRELDAEEEERTPDYMIARNAEEQRVKEALGA